GRNIQSFIVEVRPSTITLPPSPQDRDGDGFDDTQDCDDTNPGVNPSRTEIAGNGLDDDCNPATPDALPANSVACSVTSDKRSYNSNSLAQFTVRARNLSAGLDIAGLQAQVAVTDPGGQIIFATTLPVDTLSPNGQFKATLAFSTQVKEPGTYRVSLDLRFGSGVVCGSQISFAILSSAAQGKALAGSITASPSQIERGSNSTLNYQVSNIGNVDLAALSLTVLVVDASSGVVAQTLTDQTSLSKGQSFASSKSLNSAGVSAGDYLVILQGESGGVNQSVGSAFLKVTAPSNSAPDCSQARASIATLWPPNHQMVEVTILGVTDPDGDAVAIKIDRIMQDEPTNGLGDGDACPDAQGVGTSIAQLRAERSGNGNGRVYAIFFTATDARGASCQGSVRVCVPHSKNGICVDDGPVFDSTVCPQR
ncbi:MAG TPA: MopE-related protein, partial [Blastocatellia bacterium]|nr:MopE-related protein [Blastocatellia bacterium]